MGNIAELAVLALAAARITILITRDDIFEPIRHRIFMFSPPENNEHRGWYYQNFHKIKGKREYRPDSGAGWRHKRNPGFLGRLISCPDCTGVWVGFAVGGSYMLFSRETMIASLMLALAMAASWISRKGGYS